MPDETDQPSLEEVRRGMRGHKHMAENAATQFNAWPRSLDYRKQRAIQNDVRQEPVDKGVFAAGLPKAISRWMI